MVVRSIGQSSIGNTAGSTLLMTPARCSLPQPQISDSNVRPGCDDLLLESATVFECGCSFPQEQPQLDPVSGPQQHPDRAASASLTMQHSEPATDSLGCEVGHALISPGSND